MFDETRSFLNELVGFCESKRAGFMIWDELVRVYREFSFSPTVFDMILKVYAKKGMPKNALYVFDNMGWGIVPDVYACTIMVGAYCRDGRVGKAVEFVKEMGDLGFEPNAVTYHCLINGCVELGDGKGVETVLELMDQKGVSRNVITYTLVIKGYSKLCKVGEAEKMENVESALTLWKHVVARGFATGITFNTMFNGLCKMGKTIEAEEVFEKMKELGSSLDGISHRNLVDGYCKAKHMSQALLN
ncbi:pentatricopeptide repeat (PPR) superfamily protein [Actinidia rufa]|uniref:Pentatricopeptide repeat (PPR) superfamily protein n=1 Tax=Actinidia rufa TaxID=165716 RepID=A0A7J0FWA7_9ERIC|nr:pentatricopeptide repeat (PPR) superfamily protein [Actinidia rufa]